MCWKGHSSCYSLHQQVIAHSEIMERFIRDCITLEETTPQCLWRQYSHLCFWKVSRHLISRGPVTEAHFSGRPERPGESEIHGIPNLGPPGCLSLRSFWVGSASAQLWRALGDVNADCCRCCSDSQSSFPEVLYLTVRIRHKIHWRLNELSQKLPKVLQPWSFLKTSLPIPFVTSIYLWFDRQGTHEKWL